jgi:hypothetical protein
LSLVNNVFVLFGGRVFQQAAVISMGINFAHLYNLIVSYLLLCGEKTIQINDGSQNLQIIPFLEEIV